MPVDPLARIYVASRLALAAIFFYHGLVPKLLFASVQEVQMNDILMPFASREFALWSSGIAEIVLAVLLLVWFRSRLLVWFAVAFAVVVTVALLVVLPDLFRDAFNPFSINLSVAVLGWINLESVDT